jgi:hypothetical protein
MCQLELTPKTYEFSKIFTQEPFYPYSVLTTFQLETSPDYKAVKVNFISSLFNAKTRSISLWFCPNDLGGEFSEPVPQVMYAFRSEYQIVLRSKSDEIAV